jgi:hypothetical protein
MKTHRIGTITLGAMLIIFGILFLLSTFNIGLSYEIIFKLWPVILISLGSEILIANLRQPDGTVKLIYDNAAIALIIILSFFAMGMAVAEFYIVHAHIHY